MIEVWQVTFEIYRQHTGQPGRFERFMMQVDPDEYVLDAVERIWAYRDRSLVFRHACHHSTCGACGMRVNGVEKLTCITPIRSVAQPDGVLRLEPLRSFPVVADLVVDMSSLYSRLEAVNFSQVAGLEQARLPYEAAESQNGERLVDCIECGMCISACPISLTNPNYLGPAVLAAIQQEARQNLSQELIRWADHENGAWRCHAAFECSAVCPSNVDPGWRIMDLRRMLTRTRIQHIFSRRGR